MGAPYADRGGDRPDRGDRYERSERPDSVKARLRAKARKKARRQKRKGGFVRRKVCRFCADQSLEIDYRDQQYENAFAFDNPTQPAKEYQELQFAASVLYRFTEALSLRAVLKQEDIQSSDPRGAYDRLRADLSIYWGL